MKKSVYMVCLSVNINKIAWLRNARGGDCPNVIKFAELALDSGAAGITVHPRPDQRHITAQDTRELAQFLRGKPHEFNVEGNPFEHAMGSFPGFMMLIKEVKPNQCTLVPDTMHQRTSDHGWNFKRHAERLKPIIETLNVHGIRSSVFIDPCEEALEGAQKLGVDSVEFYTESYAQAYARGEGCVSFKRYCELARRAHGMGLRINAGHDLNLQNLALFASLPHLQEVSIGQALVSDALEFGFEASVQAYLHCFNQEAS